MRTYARLHPTCSAPKRVVHQARKGRDAPAEEFAGRAPLRAFGAPCVDDLHAHGERSVIYKVLEVVFVEPQNLMSCTDGVRHRPGDGFGDSVLAAR